MFVLEAVRRALNAPCLVEMGEE